MSYSMQSRWIRGLVYLGFIFLTLFDVRDLDDYVSYLPLIGLMLLILLAFIGLKIDFNFPSLIIIPVMVGYIFISFLINQSFGDVVAKSIIAILIGMLILSLKFDGTSNVWIDAVKILLLFHGVLGLIQVCYFYLSGEYYDYMYILKGVESRSLSSDGQGVQRFTGLFDEPAQLSLVIFSCSLLLVIVDKQLSNNIVFFAIVSMVSSLALSAVFFTAVLVAAYSVKKWQERGDVVGKRLAGVLLFGVICYVGYMLFVSTSTVEVLGYFSDRFFEGRDEGSFQARVALASNSSAWADFVGDGFVGDNVGIRKNGLSYIFERIGLIGISIMAYFFFTLATLAKHRLLIILFVVLTQVGTPMWTNLFWWVLVAVLVGTLRNMETTSNWNFPLETRDA